MGIRTSMATLLSIVLFFIGVFAISESAQQTKPTLNSTSANESYNLSVDVFGGITTAGGEALIWFGIAAVILVAIGLLVTASRGGR